MTKLSTSHHSLLLQGTPGCSLLLCVSHTDTVSQQTIIGDMTDWREKRREMQVIWLWARRLSFLCRCHDDNVCRHPTSTPSVHQPRLLPPSPEGNVPYSVPLFAESDKGCLKNSQRRHNLQKKIKSTGLFWYQYKNHRAWLTIKWLGRFTLYKNSAYHYPW